LLTKYVIETKNRLIIIASVAIFLFLIIGQSVFITLIDNPTIIFVLIIAFLVILFFITRGSHLLVGALIISSIVKTELSNIVGYELVDLTVSIGILIYLVLIFRIFTDSYTREVFKKHSRPLIVFALFLIALLISVFLEGGTTYGADKVSRFILLSSLAFFAPLFLIRSFDELKELFWFIMIVFILLAMSSRPNPEWYHRFSLFSADYIATGRIVGYGLLFVLFWKLPTTFKFFRIFWLILAISLVIILFAVNARGPIITMAITLCILFLVIWQLYFKSMIKVHIILIILGLLLFPLFPSLIRIISPDIDLNRISTLVDPINVLENDIRIVNYDIGLKKFLENPSLFGMGAGSYSRLGITNTSGRLMMYPHNLFLEVGLEQGIIGLLLFCIFIGLAFHIAICNLKLENRNFEFRSISVTLFGIFIYSLCNSMISSDLNGSRIILLSMGLIFSLNKSTSTLENVRETIRNI
jgi:O-antigen ligase